MIQCISYTVTILAIPIHKDIDGFSMQECYSHATVQLSWNSSFLLLKGNFPDFTSQTKFSGPWLASQLTFVKHVGFIGLRHFCVYKDRHSLRHCYYTRRITVTFVLTTTNSKTANIADNQPPIPNWPGQCLLTNVFLISLCALFLSSQNCAPYCQKLVNCLGGLQSIKMSH